jgi:hypothetical protein
VWMLNVIIVFLTPSRSSVVSGSSRGHGWPGTGMVFSENGMVKSRLLILLFTLSTTLYHPKR